MLLYVGSGILVVLGAYCWLGIKRAYDKGKTLPLRISVAIWLLDTVHFLLVVLSSLHAVWLLPFNQMATLIAGVVMAGLGLAIMLTGMIEFRSLRRISGMNSSGLVTTGIYKYSRNPQYTGWFICLLGISLIGRSGLALLFTITLVVAIHLYNVWLEEPYLERRFGEEYHLYKSRTVRYIGIPKKG